jgi:hypothetical protein
MANGIFHYTLFTEYRELFQDWIGDVLVGSSLS